MSLPLSPVGPRQDSENYRVWGQDMFFTLSVMLAPLKKYVLSKAVLYNNLTWAATQWPLGEIPREELPVL